MNRIRKACLLITIILGVTIGFTATWAADPFYQGKTIQYVISMNPGGGFDLYGRLLARHLGHHIPGDPGFVVQNMPGAGSLIAANLIYERQPGDGLTMVMLHYGVVTQALVGHAAARFDPLKYIWIGDPTVGGLPQVLWMRSDLPIQSVEDVKKAEQPLRLGSTGVGIGSGMAAEFLKYLGFPVKLVLGYRSSSEVLLALERKELDGYFISQATMQQVYRRYIDGGVVRPILALGKEPRLKPLPGVPAIGEDTPLTAQQKELYDFLVASLALLRVHAVPPGTPEDRVKILREGFMKALADPRLLEEAARLKIVVAPVSGEEVTQHVRQLAEASSETKELYKKIVGMK